MNIKLDLQLDDVKLLVALLKYSDPTHFFSRDLRTKIINQTDCQVEDHILIKKSAVQNTDGDITKFPFEQHRGREHDHTSH